MRTPQEQVCWAQTRGPSLHLRAQPQPRAAMLLANREKLCRSLERRATRMAPRRAASQTCRSPRAAQSGSREPRRAARTWEASQHSASCPRSSRPGPAWRGATAVCVSLRRPPSPEQPHLPWQAPGEEPDPEARHRPPGRGRVLSRKQAAWLGRAPENRGQGCPGHPSCHSSFGVLFQKVTALSWWCLRRSFQPACHLSPPVRSVQGSRGLTSMALTFRAGAPVSAASDPSRRPHEQPTGRPVAAAAVPGLPWGFGSLRSLKVQDAQMWPLPWQWLREGRAQEPEQGLCQL